MPEFRPSLENSVAEAETLSGTIGGRFLIGEVLGKGGMGEVYRGEDTKLKRAVALKRLAPHLRADAVYRRRFLEEAEHASRFTDSHVAAIHDVIEEKGEIFLVMEYVEGECLQRRAGISPSALALLMCSTRRLRARIPNARKRLKMYE
jgi:serine/threonine protein kinase